MPEIGLICLRLGLYVLDWGYRSQIGIICLRLGLYISNLGYMSQIWFTHKEQIQEY